MYIIKVVMDFKGFRDDLVRDRLYIKLYIFKLEGI